MVLRMLICLVVFTLLEVGGAAPAGGDTTVPITGIGTDVGAINTHVESVTYGNPVVVDVPGVGSVIELNGSVAGVGWGGGGIVARAANAHYQYDIPFVARWRMQGATKDLVIHHHGGSAPLLAQVIRDKALGPANLHRYAESAGDASVGVPALLDHFVYVSANRRGLRADGTFTATYLPADVPPLTQAEVEAISAAIAAAPGPPGFQQPGIAVGAPVPLTPFNDAPTFRDIARALEQVVGGILETSFRTRICSGLSSGARLSGFFNFGRSVIGAVSLRTGGNHVIPYDPESPRIFDGFVFIGFVYDTPVERADSELPLSAPTIFIQGQGDERYQQPIRMAHELLTKGVSLESSVRIYEIKGMTHITRDIPETVQPSNGDPVGPFVSAALRNMREWLRDGGAPPVSRIAGRIHDGGLVIDQAGGAFTTVQPIPQDPAIDSVAVDPLIIPRIIGPAETVRWLAVTAALEHENDAITPPTIGCRLGGYVLKFFGAELVPFPPETLAALYGSFEGYRDCVEAVVDALEAARLYDPRVEKARTTAELALSLFP